MKKIISSFLILISLITYGQSTQVEELAQIFISGDYDKTIIKANEFLENDTNNIDYKLLLGRALTDKGEFKKAVPHLEYTVNNDKENTWRKAWALGYLGTCHFVLQDYSLSKKSTKECIDLNATKNATRYAYTRILLFGFDDFYKSWKTVESTNFRFHFQNMSDSDIQSYISSREETFLSINKFFKSELPKKIDFFVWESREDAKKLLRTNLGFANPEFCIVHSHFQQTKGHEMTHVISHYSTKIAHKSGLINEGTAVCFDQSNQNKEQIVRAWLKANEKSISISDVWINWKNYPEEISYPLSGLYVKELIDNFGIDKYLDFFSNQTYENAIIVFGDKFGKRTKDFEDKINQL